MQLVPIYMNIGMINKLLKYFGLYHFLVPIKLFKRFNGNHHGKRRCCSSDIGYFLPVIMGWKQRRALPTNTYSNSNKNYQVKGGKPALITVMCFGALIVITQVMQIAGAIPKVG